MVILSPRSRPRNDVFKVLPLFRSMSYLSYVHPYMFILVFRHMALTPYAPLLTDRCTHRSMYAISCHVHTSAVYLCCDPLRLLLIHYAQSSFRGPRRMVEVLLT